MEKITKLSKAVYWVMAAIASIISVVFMVKIFGGSKKAIEEVMDCPDELIPEED